MPPAVPRGRDLAMCGYQMTIPLPPGGHWTLEQLPLGRAPLSLHLPPEQEWHVGLPSPGCGERVVGERMTSAASTPGPTSLKQNVFWSVSKCWPAQLLLYSLLLSRPAGLEGGLEGSVSESWGLPGLEARFSEVQSR